MSSFMEKEIYVMKVSCSEDVENERQRCKLAIEIDTYCKEILLLGEQT